MSQNQLRVQQNKNQSYSVRRIACVRRSEIKIHLSAEFTKGKVRKSDFKWESGFAGRRRLIWKRDDAAHRDIWNEVGKFAVREKRDANATKTRKNATLWSAIWRFLPLFLARTCSRITRELFRGWHSWTISRSTECTESRMRVLRLLAAVKQSYAFLCVVSLSRDIRFATSIQ